MATESVKVKRPLKIVLICVMCVAVLAAGVFAYTLFFDNNRIDENMLVLSDDGRFYEGVTVNGIALGGMTYEEADKAVAATEDDTAKDVTIQLVADDRETFDITGDEMGVESNREDILNQAMLVGRSGSVVERIEQVQTAKNEGIALETELKFDATETRAQLEDLAKELDVEAVEPLVSVKEGAVGEFTVAEGVDGKSVDVDVLYASLVAQVEQNNFASINIPFTIEKPTLSKAEVEENLVLRGVGTTNFTGTAGRIHNLNKAVSIINGELGYYKLAPGEVFTTDDTLGDRNAANGWEKAGAYLNGAVVQDYGGGICQVSTTLYNAILKGGLEVVERSSHSMPVSYMEGRRGLDAAIDRNHLDMQFKNNTDHDIYIIGYINNSSAVISFYIYGAPLEDGVDEIILTSYQTGTIQPGEEKIVEDPTKPVGYSEIVTARRTGETWAAYRHYMKDGVEVKKEKLPNTTYRAYAGERIVGTMVEETQSPTPTVDPNTTPDTGTTPDTDDGGTPTDEGTIN